MKVPFINTRIKFVIHAQLAPTNDCIRQINEFTRSLMKPKQTSKRQQAHKEAKQVMMMRRKRSQAEISEAANPREDLALHYRHEKNTRTDRDSLDNKNTNKQKTRANTLQSSRTRVSGCTENKPAYREHVVWYS